MKLTIEFDGDPSEQTPKNPPKKIEPQFDDIPMKKPEKMGVTEASCDAKDCRWNNGGYCATNPSITKGAKCEIYNPGQVKDTQGEPTQSVIKCNAGECTHNKEGQCNVQEIAVLANTNCGDYEAGQAPAMEQENEKNPMSGNELLRPA